MFWAAGASRHWQAAASSPRTTCVARAVKLLSVGGRAFTVSLPHVDALAPKGEPMGIDAVARTGPAGSLATHPWRTRSGRSNKQKTARRRPLCKPDCDADQASRSLPPFRRYAMKPTPQKPRIIIAQVDGSGTAGANSEVIVPELLVPLIPFVKAY